MCQQIEEEAAAHLHFHGKGQFQDLCLQVCYYRDKNSINKFQVAKVTSEGVDICEPFALETNWDFKVSICMLCNDTL